MYAVDNGGAENNIQFAPENEWIVDSSSFHFEKAKEKLSTTNLSVR